MLELNVYDSGRECRLRFEHSLLSVSKWEEEYKTPFLTAQKTSEQMIDYYRYMLLPSEHSPDLVYRLTPEQLERLADYINETRTASFVPRESGKKSGETVTSELMYYWLVAHKIPFHPVETWHLSRLTMLVEMTSYKNSPPKKQRRGEFMDKFRAANEANKKLFNSNG